MIVEQNCLDESKNKLFKPVKNHRTSALTETAKYAIHIRFIAYAVTHDCCRNKAMNMIRNYKNYSAALAKALPHSTCWPVELAWKHGKNIANGAVAKLPGENWRARTMKKYRGHWNICRKIKEIRAKDEIPRNAARHSITWISFGDDTSPLRSRDADSDGGEKVMQTSRKLGGKTAMLDHFPNNEPSLRYSWKWRIVSCLLFDDDTVINACQ